MIYNDIMVKLIINGMALKILLMCIFFVSCV